MSTLYIYLTVAGVHAARNKVASHVDELGALDHSGVFVVVRFLVSAGGGQISGQSALLGRSHNDGTAAGRLLSILSVFLCTRSHVGKTDSPYLRMGWTRDT